MTTASELAKRYVDYREMLDKQKEIEAVLVATADHMHAPIAVAAMQMGKHVYVQKPLTWSVAESRELARIAKSAHPEVRRRAVQAVGRIADKNGAAILETARQDKDVEGHNIFATHDYYVQRNIDRRSDIDRDIRERQRAKEAEYKNKKSR